MFPFIIAVFYTSLLSGAFSYIIYEECLRFYNPLPQQFIYRPTRLRRIR